jgi:hypothetical protein
MEDMHGIVSIMHRFGKVGEIDNERILGTDDTIVSTFRSGRFSVSFWAAIDSHNRLRLQILDLPGTKPVKGRVVDKGGFTARRYIDQVLDLIAKTIWTRKKLTETA